MLQRIREFLSRWRRKRQSQYEMTETERLFVQRCLLNVQRQRQRREELRRFADSVSSLKRISETK
jgi:hypothetical protein